MDKKELASIIKKEIEKISPQEGPDLIISHHDEIYPVSEKESDSYFVQISFGPKEDEPSPMQPHLDFWCDEDKKIIRDVKINLRHLSNQGLGRKLQNLMENAARQLHYKEIRINLFKGNPDFWEHIGYRPKKDYLSKTI